MGVILENMQSYFPAQSCLITNYGYIRNNSAYSSLFILALHNLQQRCFLSPYLPTPQNRLGLHLHLNLFSEEGLEMWDA